MAKLIWTATGDTIDLVLENHQVYEYFLSNLNARGLNRYPMVGLRLASLSEELLEKLKKLQTFVKTQLKLDLFDFDFDPSKQQDLNTLHRAWVKLHIKYPNIGVVFDKSTLDRINELVHWIEERSQNFCVSTGDPKTCFHNPFGTSILNHGIWNLCIDFENPGRLTYNKWRNGDTVNDVDTNDFQEMYTQLRIRVRPSEPYQLPVEYQNWCRQYGFECVGRRLPLANFDNMEENLLKYRQLVFNNALVENNFIILE